MVDQDLSVPGTVKLLEGADSATQQTEVIFLPTPTGNINDPITWPKWKKFTISANLLLWTFLANAAIAWTSPAWGLWTVELNTTYTQLNYGQATLVLMCGVGCFFLQPCALKYGRRGPYILGGVLILIGLVIGIFMTSINFFFAYMILSGIGSAPSYTTIVTSLMDISFHHQKGRMLSLYGISLIAGNFLPPVAAGYIVDKQGWKWCFYYLVIFFGISTLLVMFCAEETMFPRNSVLSTELEAVAATCLEGEKFDHSLQEVEQRDSRCSNQDPSAFCAAVRREEEEGHQHTQVHPAVPSQRYNYREKMTLFRRNPDVKVSYARLTLEVLDMLALPAAAWAGVLIMLGTFVVSLVFTTQASFFTIPPYNFTPAQLGLMYFALLIGDIIGTIYGGSFADWLVLRQARRNNGIAEPEHRLLTFAPIPWLAAGGILLYGVGASQGLHWIVPCIGLVFIGLYLNASLIALCYALDSYPEISGEIVQLSNVIRNVGGGAFSFCIQPWITRNGPQTATIIMAVLILVLNLTYLPFQLWGKGIRRMTKARYDRIVGRNSYY